jgi:hypothetical protein
MARECEVSVQDGKYKFWLENGVVNARRYDEVWSGFENSGNAHNNSLAALIVELYETRRKLEISLGQQKEA